MDCPLGNSYTQLFKDGLSMCCPAWNSLGIVSKGEKGYVEFWNSQEFQKKLDEAVCLPSCPHFTGNNSSEGFYRKLRRIMVSFDETCNLQCQTCRSGPIITDPVKLKKEFQEIENAVGKTLEGIELSGAGDPIASPVLRKWLMSFSESKFPNLTSIFIQTNGLLFTEKFYNNLPDFVKKRLSRVMISVDAATKETYEKIRKGGKWSTLQKNLRFVGSNSQIGSMTFCFVVQTDNYKEIVDFYNMAREIAGNKARVMYQQVQKWGDRISQEEFDRQNVFASKDPEVLAELRRQLKEVQHKQGVLMQISDIPAGKVTSLV